MVFIGLDGHHNSGEGGASGGKWLADNRDKLFAKTALVINAEHPSTLQTYVRPRYEENREHCLVERVHRPAVVCRRSRRGPSCRRSP